MTLDAVPWERIIGGAIIALLSALGIGQYSEADDARSDKTECIEVIHQLSENWAQALAERE